MNKRPKIKDVFNYVTKRSGIVDVSAKHEGTHRVTLYFNSWFMGWVCTKIINRSMTHTAVNKYK